MRNSKIWLSKNIKLDKDYKAVLNYTENQLLDLMENQNNLIYYSNQYSFVRETGEIIVQVPYSQCIQANYMAFQNPDYSNKIFFAFIDSIDYASEKATKIRFTIDVWSTWFSYWSAKACYVVREHVTNDSIGSHTIPEGLETGEYISNNLQPRTSGITEMCFAVASSIRVFSTYSTAQESLPTGAFYAGFTTVQGVYDYIKLFDDVGQGDAVISVFTVPKDFFQNWGTLQGIDGQCSSSVIFEKHLKELSITIPTTVGKNYSPKNNKLFCYPYSYLQVSNHSGQIVNYNWEDFGLFLGRENSVTFDIYGALTPSGSMTCIPTDYKNMNQSSDDNIVLGKLPIGAFTNDSYTNWLTQNGVNVGMQLGGGSLAVIGGVATGNLLMAGGGLVSITNTANQIYQHHLIPPQASGNVCVGDVNYTLGLYNLAFKYMSVRDEMAKVIDDYFTRMGYKVNRVKVPNMSHRQNYNYVQIASEDNVAYVNNYNNICPSSKDLDQINALFRRGITIWNNHTNLGDYSVSNNITN